MLEQERWIIFIKSNVNCFGKTYQIFYNLLSHQVWVSKLKRYGPVRKAFCLQIPS